MKLRITINEKEATAILYDSPTGRDFASLLPLTLKMEDYNGTEKICQLPHKLSTEGAPSGFEPSVGEITYYEPWGNIALFYREFGYANGLIALGRVISGLDAFTTDGLITVRLEFEEEEDKTNL